MSFHFANTALDTTVPRRFVILLSGKRKSGKDFVAERLLPALQGSDAVILRLSGPLKKCYAEQHDLDYAKLMSSDGYKEKYRRDMIRWSEEIRYTFDENAGCPSPWWSRTLVGLT